MQFYQHCSNDGRCVAAALGAKLLGREVWRNDQGWTARSNPREKGQYRVAPYIDLAPTTGRRPGKGLPLESADLSLFKRGRSPWKDGPEVGMPGSLAATINGQQANDFLLWTGAHAQLLQP